MIDQHHACGWTGTVPSGQDTASCVSCGLMRSRREVQRCQIGGPASYRPPRPEPRHRATERVGAALSALIDGLFNVRAGTGCGCSMLAEKMDGWGLAGCETNREIIIDRLVENRDMLVSAITAAGWLHAALRWTAGSWLAQKVMRHGAGMLLDKAIANVRDSMTGNERNNPFRPSKEVIRFVTTKQYTDDIARLSSMVPAGTTCIAGVARSGLHAATMIAMNHHLPLLTIRQTNNDIIDAGNGWRLGSGHVNADRTSVFVVDDTVMTGNSIRAIRPLLDREFGRESYKIGVVYKNPNAMIRNEDHPDFHAVDLSWPHLLEWNLFNSILSPVMACDFDGILCQDCKPGEDDDGPRYADFLRFACPLYTPRRCEIPLIVTARLERYRSITEDWLAGHGIRFSRLVMHPASTLSERQRDDIAAFKARHYAEWAATVTPSPEPVLFVESEDRQSRRIAAISGRHVVCPATGKVY